MTTTLLILVGLVAWLLLNWLSPRATVLAAERMSPARIPAELNAIAEELGVEFYISNLARGYGFSAWTWPRTIVVFDREFLRQCTPSFVRFVIGHELGHCVLGHLRRRWLYTVTLAVLLPAYRRRLEVFEDEADDYATLHTGMKREFFTRGDPTSPQIPSANAPISK